MNEKKVLIVEDEGFLLDLLSNKLKSEGFAVIGAKNGEEGLKTTLEEKPDLILLDLIMPVMDGITMLKKLRESEEGKTVPVIVLTNLSESEKVEEAIKAGVHDYLVKTAWSPEDMVKKIKEKFAG